MIKTFPKWSSTISNFSVGIFLFLLSLTVGDAQEFVNYDKTYLESIKTVQFAVPGLQTGYPIIALAGSGLLNLRFDEIASDSRYLRYKITHHNRDWTKTDLEELEFLEGFNEEELRDHDFSFNTLTSYVHYRLTIPNRDLRWTKSGNYMIHVYDEDTNEPILSRRFMVNEAKVGVLGKVLKPSNVSKINTHHEIDFVVQHKEYRISNPRQYIHAVIMQNGRWETAITDVVPFLERPDELVFNFQDKIVFPAGKEFRNFDTRTLRSRTRYVEKIERYDDAFEVRLKKEKSRAFRNYLSEKDNNGLFVIESYDDNNFNLEADYAYIVFTLESAQPLYDHDVYLLGRFTDWQIDEAYKMQYYDRNSAYSVETLLKQGYYDYMYAAVSKETKEVSTNMLEGNWHETDNVYTILIYYRPFGERYDKLIGVTSLN